MSRNSYDPEFTMATDEQARLFHLAPELLESLVEVAAHLESVLRNTPNVTWPPHFPQSVPTLARAFAIIAKAKGGAE